MKAVVYMYLRKAGFSVTECKKAFDDLENGNEVVVYEEPCDCGDQIRHNDGGNYHEIVSLVPVGNVVVLEHTDTRWFDALGERSEIYIETPNGKVVALWGYYARYIDPQKANILADFRDGESELFYGELGTLNDIPGDWFIPDQVDTNGTLEMRDAILSNLMKGIK